MAKDMKIKKFTLVYQDTYVFGKGYMKATEVKVPAKYLKLK